MTSPLKIRDSNGELKTSACNELHGTVLRCQDDAVNGEAIIDSSRH